MGSNAYYFKDFKLAINLLGNSIVSSSGIISVIEEQSNGAKALMN
jgi:hypothetical protein